MNRNRANAVVDDSAVPPTRLFGLVDVDADVHPLTKKMPSRCYRSRTWRKRCCLDCLELVEQPEGKTETKNDYRVLTATAAPRKTRRGKGKKRNGNAARVPNILGWTEGNNRYKTGTNYGTPVCTSKKDYRRLASGRLSPSCLLVKRKIT